MNIFIVVYIDFSLLKDINKVAALLIKNVVVPIVR